MIVNLLNALEANLLGYFSERKQPIESGELIVPKCFQFDFPEKTDKENEHFPHFLLTVHPFKLRGTEEVLNILIGLGVHSPDGYEDGCKQLLTMAEGVKLALVANKTLAKKYALNDEIETAVLPKGEQNPPYYYGGVTVSYTYKYLTPSTENPGVILAGGYGEK